MLIAQKPWVIWWCFCKRINYNFSPWSNTEKQEEWRVEGRTVILFTLWILRRHIAGIHYCWPQLLSNLHNVSLCSYGCCYPPNLKNTWQNWQAISLGYEVQDHTKGNAVLRNPTTTWSIWTNYVETSSVPWGSLWRFTPYTSTTKHGCIFNNGIIYNWQPQPCKLVLSPSHKLRLIDWLDGFYIRNYFSSYNQFFFLKPWKSEMA